MKRKDKGHILAAREVNRAKEKYGRVPLGVGIQTCETTQPSVGIHTGSTLG